MDIFDISGWIGMICVLLAYLLLSFKKIENGIFYQVLNLVAGILMAIGLFPKSAWFSFTLQVIWSLIAMVSIVQLVRHPSRSSRKKKTKH